MEASQGPPEPMQHIHPLHACELDRERGYSRHLRHHKIFDGVMPAVSKPLVGPRFQVSGQLIQEECLLFQTGSGAQAVGSLDLQHEVIVDDIDTGLPTSLINAGDGISRAAMAPQSAQLSAHPAQGPRHWAVCKSHEGG